MRRRGFTLTEMLITIGIIVLVVAIAVPSFKALMGGHSTEAAQNNVSAVLARARTEALGLQEPRGILFYRDLDTQRVGMMMVKPNNTSEPWELDIVADRDPVLLPVGVGAQFIDNAALNNATNPPTRQDDGYLGFNSASATTATAVAFGSVVLFDGKGRLLSDEYGIQIRKPAQLPAFPAPRSTDIGKFLYNNPSLTGAGALLIRPTGTTWYNAAIGLALYNQDEFSNVDQANDADPQATAGAYSAAEEAEEKWLDANAVPMLVNRYNGTLVRSE